MPLAMINVRLDAGLKDRVDPKLQHMGALLNKSNFC